MHWLESTLAGAQGDCRIAFWHRPRYSEGAYGGAPDLNPLWNRLAGHARIVLSGHDHNLQRHRPQHGIAQYVVGAGGRGRYALHRGRSTMVWGRDDVNAALRIVLTPGRALLEFRGAARTRARPQPRDLHARRSRARRPVAFAPMDEPVVILCGGRGTRLREHTQTIPKPLVEIGGRPILWHVIRIYAHQGFHRFVLCLGHKGELIEEFVRNNGLPEGLSIDCVQTGEETPDRRPHRARARPASRTAASARPTPTASPTSTCTPCSTSTRATAALATMTVVQPELQFGVARLNGEGVVEGFEEKPQFEGWINGGFFVLRAGRARLHRGRLRPRARAAREPRRATASCAPTGTPASGTAWTPTRTRSSSTTCGRRGGRPGRNLHRLRRKPRA